MTTPTMMTAPAPTRHSPASRRLAWNTWRQHRITLIVLMAGFISCMIWLGVHGLQAHAAYGEYLTRHCLTSSSLRCNRIFARVQDATRVGGLLPWLIGVFIGAPLAARDPLLDRLPARWPVWLLEASWAAILAALAGLLAWAAMLAGRVQGDLLRIRHRFTHSRGRQRASAL